MFCPKYLCFSQDDILTFFYFIRFQFLCCLNADAIIRDGDHKSWDPRAPMICDNFAIFFGQSALPCHISTRIHTHVVGSRMDVVMLRDQMARAARFSCGFFTAMAGNKNQSAYM